MGIDSITHEQAVIPGLATRINSLFVKKVFLSWPQSAVHFEKGKIEIIGNPLRKTLFGENPKSNAIASFLKNPHKVIYITGGNQGSHFLNQLVFNNFSAFVPYRIVHQVGTANWQGDWDQAKGIQRKNYLACDFIDSQDVGAILDKAQVVIARAGANTIWELAVFKKPAILIPLPVAASQEQFQNAKVLEEAGSALILEQKEASAAKLRREIERIIANYAKFKKAANNLALKLPQDAASKLAKYITRAL